MARSLAVTLNMLLEAVLASEDGTTVTTIGADRVQDELESGTGLDQADQVWHDLDRTLAATTSENIDLSGALTNAQGETVTFTKNKVVFIRNKTDAAETSVILVAGGAAANAWEGWTTAAGSTMKAAPGGGFILLFDPSAAGMAVTAGTGDILKIENLGSAEATYDIIIVGVKA